MKLSLIKNLGVLFMASWASSAFAASGTSAYSGPNRPEYLNSLHDIAIVVAVPEGTERSQAHCRQLTEAAPWEMRGTAHCFRTSDPMETMNVTRFVEKVREKTGAQGAHAGIRYFLILTRGPKNTYRVEVRDLFAAELKEYYGTSKAAETVVTSKTAFVAGSQRDGFGRFLDDRGLRNFVEKTLIFMNHQQKLKNVLMINGIDMSKSLAYDSRAGRFYRCRIKVVNEDGSVSCTSREALSAWEATMAFADEKNAKGEYEQANYLRAGLQIGTILGISAVWYQISEFKDDWDFAGKPFGEVMRAKLVTFDAWKYDDNSFGINAKHIFPAGWAYYGVFRSNGISPSWSLLFSMLTSTLWETTVEYREVTSKNDQIFTPFAGAEIAEAGYQLGRVLRAKPDLAAKVVGHLVDPFTTLNRFLEKANEFLFGGPKARTSENYEEMRKIYSEISAHFSAGIHVRTSDSNRNLPGSTQTDRPTNSAAKINLIGKVVNIPEYLEKGTEADFIADIVATDARLTGTPYGRPSEWGIQARHLLSALYLKRINENNLGELSGFSLLIGPGTGLSMGAYIGAKNNFQEDGEDFSAILHVLGPSIQLVLLKNDVKMSIDMSITGDLGMVKSYAIEAYEQSHGDAGLSTLTGRKHYFYTYGYTTRSELKIDYMGWTAGVGAMYSKAHDMNPNMVYPESPYSTVDNGAESLMGLDAFLEYRVFEKWGVRLTGQYRERKGLLGQAVRTTTDLAGFLSVVYYF